LSQSQGVNRQIRLASHPTGLPTHADLPLSEGPVPGPGDGQMLLRTIYLSLDPYMRGRMGSARSYAKGVGFGDVMVGQTVSRVVESNLDGYAPGDFVLSFGGWQEYSLSDGRGARKLDPALAPLSTALGVLGMPGMTAYVGLFHIGRLEEGDEVVVSAASGAVGGVVGQIAKLKGCRVVGVAGAPEKCAYVTEELGFDACVSHKSDSMADELAAACPDGVDLYFENVGGKVFEAVLPLLNDFARVPVCGRIAAYNDTELPAGPNRIPMLMGMILVRRLTFRGFIVSDHPELQPDFLRDIAAWVRAGKVKYREDIVDGLENTVDAFLGLFRGANFGKLLIRVSDDPTRQA
jgi:NADPH-dependent curcumin reductase CurA